jgi:Flp pilus assembly protein TadB
MAISSAVLIVSVATTYHPKLAAIRIYDRINSQLRERKKGWFDYQKTLDFLRRYGAAYHYGTWIDPIKYLTMRVGLAAAGILGGLPINMIAAFLFAVVGFQLPHYYLFFANKKDNEDQLQDVKLVYQALAIQIKAGVYVTDALTECYSSVKSKRLRVALMELSSEIIINADIKIALGNFHSKFASQHIDALCVILLQAQESGKAVDLLTDISDQIKDMEAGVLLKQKGKLDRQVTVYLLGTMAAVLAVVLYASVSEMMNIVKLF